MPSLLLDSTNSVSQRRTQTSKPARQSTLKSLPTCTISLALANGSSSSAFTKSPDIHDVPVHLVSLPSSFVPFPSPPLSRSDLDEQLPTPQLLPSPRRRSNAWLPPHRPQPYPSAKPKSRKRASKTSGKRLTSDLQFLSLVQRSIARKLAERGMCVGPEGALRGGDGYACEREREAEDRLEVQDVVLVKRIRSYLLEQGCKPASLDCDCVSDPNSVEDSMDVDVFPLPSRQPLQTIYHAPEPPRSPVVPFSALVASLILRHKDRSAVHPKPNSSLTRPAPNEAARSPRVVSPLALCVCVEDMHDP